LTAAHHAQFQINQYLREESMKQYLLYAKKAAIFTVSAFVLLVASGCASSKNDNSTTPTPAPDTSLTGDYRGLIWDKAEENYREIKIIFVHNGSSLTGTMYMDSDQNGSFHDTGDSVIAINATVGGNSVNMSIAGSGTVILTQAEYTGTATTSCANLKMISDFALASDPNDTAHMGHFDVHKIGNAQIIGKINSIYDLTGAYVQIHIMYGLDQEEALNLQEIEGSTAAEYNISFTDVINGTFYIAVTVDINDDGNAEYFGIYGANRANAKTYYDAWIAGTEDGSLLQTATVSNGQSIDIGTIELADVQ
jgi:hypothetical protein